MIHEGAKLFDKLIVAIGTNPSKAPRYSLAQRLEWLFELCKPYSNVQVTEFSNEYLVEYAASVGATYLLRGLRNAEDYAYETKMRNVNGDLHPEIETVFLMTPRDLAEVSSGFVTGLIGPTGWERVVARYLPDCVSKRVVELAHAH